MKIIPKSASLQERIIETCNDADAYIIAYAKEVTKGSPGVPFESNLLQIRISGGGDVCKTALHIMATRKKAADLIERQARESQQPQPAR
jgi:hypothetical protein